MSEYTQTEPQTQEEAIEMLRPLIMTLCEGLTPIISMFSNMTLSFGVRSEDDHNRLTVLLNGQLIYTERD